MPLRFRDKRTDRDHPVECFVSLNLLAHAQMLEIDVGSRCGGHGVCGGDRIKLSSQQAFSEPTEIERKHLSPLELSQGYRLACQCFPEQPDLDAELLF